MDPQEISDDKTSWEQHRDPYVQKVSTRSEVPGLAEHANVVYIDIDCINNFQATLFKTYIAKEKDVKAVQQEQKRLLEESSASRSLETRLAKHSRGAEKALAKKNLKVPTQTAAKIRLVVGLQ